MTYNKIIKELKEAANPEKVKDLSRFFKTGKGEYGEGDVFWGITVPNQRKVAKKYFKEISFADVIKLMQNKVHEQRLTGFIILVYKYEKADQEEQEKIFKLYLKHKKYANNWDIIDVTCPKTIGYYLLNNKKERKILFELAKSSSLWDRRIAVLATFPFVDQGIFSESIKIAELLVHDKHDLIHKAVGWMLREIGKKDKATEEVFLNKHYKTMPRTMLRYAIEKFTPQKRKYYLS